VQEVVAAIVINADGDVDGRHAVVVATIVIDADGSSGIW